MTWLKILHCGLIKYGRPINYGIDRRKMILYLRNSLGTAAESGFVPIGLPSYDDSFGERI